ncbi:hypothetical protein WAX74_03615 [Psychrobacillus sp. FJAT-51614]|uniref:Uncharacterized protein n=1 Tax=Psychrobacillus mangrovi TaxID=3117745 RepID=A0ABU8F3W9_9BACI
MKNLVKIIAATVLLLSLTIAHVGSASASTPAKIMWGKTELKIGQIGKVTILEDTPLVKITSDGKLTTVRTLKKGDEYRVYSYKSTFNGLYGVGAGSFVQKNSKLKYETPSKKKLEILGFQKLFQEARAKQLTTITGYHTKQDILTLFNPYFTEEFTSQFISNSMLTKDINGVTHYHFPQNTDNINDNFLVEGNFAWTEKTSIMHYQAPSVDKDNNKGTENLVKISEYRNWDEFVKPHTYTIKLLKIDNKTYKIVEIQKQY